MMKAFAALYDDLAPTKRDTGTFVHTAAKRNLNNGTLQLDSESFTLFFIQSNKIGKYLCHPIPIRIASSVLTLKYLS